MQSFLFDIQLLRLAILLLEHFATEPPESEEHGEQAAVGEVR